MELSEEIVNRLLGSRKAHLGGCPDKEAFDFMCNLVGTFIKDDRPLRTVTPWGGIKCYGHMAEADNYDLLALKRLDSINTSIKEVYSPGLTGQIIQEDTTEYILTLGEVKGLPEQYTKTLRTLIEASAIEFVTVTPESEILGDRLLQFVNSAKRNAYLLYRYWTEIKDGYSIDKAPALHDLQSVQWTGTLSPDIWNHYIQRTVSEYPELTASERARQVAKYFGCSLARKQFSVTPIGVIKASFCPYPKGTNPKLYLGRVEYKLKDSSNSHNSTPPWLLGE